MAQWLDQKKLPSASQSQTCTKKCHGHCLVVCCWSDPLQLSEFQQNHYIWQVCLADQWNAPKTATPPTSIGQQKGPNSSPRQHPTACHTANASEVELIGLQSLIHHIHLTSYQPTTISSSMWTTFLRGKHYYNQQETENAFQEFTESWSTDFYATGINRLFSLAKVCWL